MPFTNQQSRLLSVVTPLGPDVLLLTGFTGHEELSRLFSYQLDMVSEDGAISAKDIVGKGVTWTVRAADGEPRYFHGVVSRFSAGGLYLQSLRTYRLEVVPWLWFLTRTANCRIFQNKTTPEIIQAVFSGYGLTDYELNLQRSYPPWEYCVQYRETAYNFVSRLLEHEGVFYYFRHEEGKHTLVVGDHKGAFQDCPESQVEYTAGSLSPNHIRSWEHQYEFRPGKWTQTDYNFKTPSASMLTSTKTLVDLPGVDKFEVFDYPGEYTTKGDGEKDTRVRMEEEEAPYDVAVGASGCCTFTPGGKFTLEAHEVEAEWGKGYVLTSVQHTARDTSLGNDSPGAEYSNTFTCIPDSVTFRPARVTPKPIVQGPQTAVVVGPAGEEIFTDQYGRVKVQFFWDREGKKDENSSCWIRVAQNWAGKAWGLIANPRMGQEVVVDFLEGDPDRPLITGRVYNAEQMPPYALPANQTQTGIKTRSSKGGGPDNFNEIRFEDKMGGEQVYIHAEKNQDIVVENDETHSVGHDRTKSIGNDETTSVGHDRTETVGNNETITIGVDRTETVGSNETISIGSNRTETVGASESITVALTRTRLVGINESVTVGAAQEVTVGGLRAVTVGLTQAVTVGAGQTITVGGSETETYAKDHTQTVGGGQKVTVAKDSVYAITGGRTTNVGKDDGLTVAKKLTITAGEEIIIKTGEASIIMKKDGSIAISGKDILVKATGKITEKADGDFVIKGSKVGIN